MRCPNGTRKHKMSGKCEPRKKRSRCVNGYRRNKDGICQPTLRLRINNSLNTPDSEYRGAPLHATGTSEHFINLCKKHILGQRLDGVLEIIWMQKGDCNVFFIGEMHQTYTNTTCTPILEMFKSLMKENINSAHPVKIDIMIEMLEESTGFNISNLIKHGQLSRVREFLTQCITSRRCSVNVHWTDPSLIKSDKNPAWLTTLGNPEYYVHLGTDKWMENENVKVELQTKEDVIKLLTKNVMAMKEIERATKVDPEFKQKSIDFFNEIFETQVIHAKGNWKKCVILQLRRVMDVYTSARIVKSNMKHIIVYAGQYHTNAMFRFLSICGFSVMDYQKGQCL